MRAARWPILGVVAGAVALGAWLLARGGDGAAETSNPGRIEAERPSAPLTLASRSARRPVPAESERSPDTTAEPPKPATPDEPPNEPEREYGVRIRVVDARTGAAVPGAWVGRPVVFSMPNGSWGGSWNIVPPASEKEDESDCTRPLVPGVPCGGQFPIYLPEGYIRAAGPYFPPFVAAHDAKTLLVVHPLWPELDARLSVEDADGRPVARKLQVGIELGGEMMSGPKVRHEVMGPGLYRLRGIPFLPGEPLKIQVAPKAGDRDGNGVPELPVSEGLPKPQWSGVLPFDRSARVEASITLAADAEGWIADQVEVDFDELLLIDEPHPGADSGVGTATVRVRRRDGSPASRVRLAIEKRQVRTDDAGTAEFADLAVGGHEVRLVEPGLVPVSATLAISAGRETTIELVESRGGRVEVRVVDAEGRGLPFAKIEVKTPSGVPWIDLQDGVQRIDPYVDQNGRRVLNDVETGDVTIKAVYGSRRGETTVRVSEGVGTRAEIVVK